MSKIPPTSSPVLTDQGAFTLPWIRYFQDLTFQAGSAGVSSFNTRTGAVNLQFGDVTSALGFAPLSATAPAFGGSAAKLTTPRTIAINGDLAWSVTFDGSSNVLATGTLATVNSNVGTFGSPVAVPVVTLNAKGLATSAATVVPIVPGCIYGMQASPTGASATMPISAGSAADRTNAVMIAVAAAFTKTGGSWIVGSGNGGLDTGAIAANTTYHFHAIRRPDTGVTDYAFSLSPTAPTTGGSIPVAYTQSRRIFSWRTDGSNQWFKGVQLGDEFYWDTPTQDGSAIATVTTAALRAMTVPTGINVTALVTVTFGNNSIANSALLVTSPLLADRVPNAILGDMTSFAQTTADLNQVVAVRIPTDTSGRIRHRANVTTGTLYFVTAGWIDTRGRLG